MSQDEHEPSESGEGGAPSLNDGDIVSARTYGRRALLRTVGVTVLAAGLAAGVGIATARRASADPSYGDYDAYDEAQSDGDSARVSDPKDSDQTTMADAGDSDERTFADPHWQTGDSDQGTFRDPKDSDVTTYADAGDAD